MCVKGEVRAVSAKAFGFAFVRHDSAKRASTMALTAPSVAPIGRSFSCAILPRAMPWADRSLALLSPLRSESGRAERRPLWWSIRSSAISFLKLCFQRRGAMLLDTWGYAFRDVGHCFRTARTMLLACKSYAPEVTEHCSSLYRALLRRLWSIAP